MVRWAGSRWRAAGILAHVNAFWSALWGGVLALAGSAMGIYLQGRMERRARGEERAAEEASRLRDRRAELYVDLLRRPPGTEQERRAWESALAARSAAFGSVRVDELLRSADEAAEAVSFYASENGFMDYEHHFGVAPEPDDELKRLMKIRDDVGRELRAQVRAELGTPD